MTTIKITGKNFHILRSIINDAKKHSYKEVKLNLPFKLFNNGRVVSLAESAHFISVAQIQARKIGLLITSGYNSGTNPYLPKNNSFFNTHSSKIKINIIKHSSKPVFSIIIPTYNRSDHLQNVLNSFFVQNYPKDKYEIIIVDDGSDDDTLGVIKKINSPCNLKYIFWPRMKIKMDKKYKDWAKFYNRVGLVRNIGIMHARGEIILFNDSDILVTEDNLKRHEYYHKREDNVIVRGFRMMLPRKFKLDNKKIFNFKNLNKIASPERFDYQTDRGKEKYYLQKKGWQKLVTANLSIKKKYLERVGGFDGDYVFWGFEDLDLGYRLSKLDIKLVFDKNIKVYHQYHEKECYDEIGDLMTFWLNVGIFYRKYLDYDAFILLRRIILNKLDLLILGN